MSIIFLDPSSTCVGYALMAARSTLIEIGRLTPQKTRLDALIRIEQFGKELAEVIADLKPSHAVIEVPSGHVGRARHQGGGAGLSTYGVAVGYLWRELRVTLPVEVVYENEWTRGVPKEKRLARIAAVFKDYADLARRGGDPGGDVGDAIGLGQYWYARRAVCEVLTKTVQEN